MDIKALRLEGRFSLAPNCLGYCGKESARKKLRDCTINGNCRGVEKELKDFIVLYPYLKTISQVTKLPIFSYKVIESYWFGSNLLKKIKNEHYDLLLSNFKKQGVPSWLIKELKEKKPIKFIPNHLFQVLHVGVGRASASVPYDLKSINNCMIRWGKVEKINPSTSLRTGKRKATIILNSLKDKLGKSLALKKVTLPIDVGFTPKLKVGDIVAVHWGMIIKTLTQGEVKKVSFWTKEVLKSLT
jgi:hypothetical protein